ncbi:MAG: acetyl-CoA C-acyltransferase [Alphaproteobacteria bacterium]
MSNNNDPVVIVGAMRTAIGGFQGVFSSIPASRLGAEAIKAALSQSGVAPSSVSEVLMGCVLTAGQGQAPARQASLAADIPNSVPTSTINKVCGSGMKSVMFGYDALQVRPNEVIVAGGLENMTNAPYLLPKARDGLRLGHGRVMDHMFLDGLEDSFEPGRLMGTYAEDTATKYGFTRREQDDFAIESLEIVAITAGSRKAPVTVDKDEQPFQAKPEKIPQLKPAFREGGTVTAANSSSISDGAAALVLMRESEAKRRGLKPLAKITGHTSHAQEPEWFTTAPVGAIQKLFEATGWKNTDVDLYEINEAFAVTTMAAMRDLSLPSDIVNVNGGACALGHPIGASGTRIIVTLLNALKRRGGRRGIASLCIGGGEATAIGLEMY